MEEHDLNLNSDNNRLSTDFNLDLLEPKPGLETSRDLNHSLELPYKNYNVLKLQSPAPGSEDRENDQNLKLKFVQNYFENAKDDPKMAQPILITNDRSSSINFNEIKIDIFQKSKISGNQLTTRELLKRLSGVNTERDSARDLQDPAGYVNNGQNGIREIQIKFDIIGKNKSGSSSNMVSERDKNLIRLSHFHSDDIPENSRDEEEDSDLEGGKSKEDFIQKLQDINLKYLEGKDNLVFQGIDSLKDKINVLHSKIIDFKQETSSKINSSSVKKKEVSVLKKKSEGRGKRVKDKSCLGKTGKKLRKNITGLKANNGGNEQTRKKKVKFLHKKERLLYGDSLRKSSKGHREEVITEWISKFKRRNSKRSKHNNDQKKVVSGGGVPKHARNLNYKSNIVAKKSHKMSKFKKQHLKSDEKMHYSKTKDHDMSPTSLRLSLEAKRNLMSFKKSFTEKLKKLNTKKRYKLGPSYLENIDDANSSTKKISKMYQRRKGLGGSKGSKKAARNGTEESKGRKGKNGKKIRNAAEKKKKALQMFKSKSKVNFPGVEEIKNGLSQSVLKHNFSTESLMKQKSSLISNKGKEKIGYTVCKANCRSRKLLFETKLETQKLNKVSSASCLISESIKKDRNGSNIKIYEKYGSSGGKRNSNEKLNKSFGSNKLVKNKTRYHSAKNLQKKKEDKNSNPFPKSSPYYVKKMKKKQYDKDKIRSSTTSNFAQKIHKFENLKKCSLKIKNGKSKGKNPNQKKVEFMTKKSKSVLNKYDKKGGNHYGKAFRGNFGVLSGFSCLDFKDNQRKNNQMKIKRGMSHKNLHNQSVSTKKYQKTKRRKQLKRSKTNPKFKKSEKNDLQSRHQFYFRELERSKKQLLGVDSNDGEKTEKINFGKFYQNDDLLSSEQKDQLVNGLLTRCRRAASKSERKSEKSEEKDQTKKKIIEYLSKNQQEIELSYALKDWKVHHNELRMSKRM